MGANDEYFCDDTFECSYYINRFDYELGCALKLDLLREYIQGLDDRGVSWYPFKDVIARSGQTLVASSQSAIEASLLPLLMSRETRLWIGQLHNLRRENLIRSQGLSVQS